MLKLSITLRAWVLPPCGRRWLETSKIRKSGLRGQAEATLPSQTAGKRLGMNGTGREVYLDRAGEPTWFLSQKLLRVIKLQSRPIRDDHAQWDACLRLAAGVGNRGFVGGH